MFAVTALGENNAYPVSWSHLAKGFKLADHGYSSWGAGLPYVIFSHPSSLLSIVSDATGSRVRIATLYGRLICACHSTRVI